MSHLLSRLALAGLATVLASGAAAQLAPPVRATQLPVQVPGLKGSASALTAPPLRRKLPKPPVPGVALPSPGKALAAPVGSTTLGNSLESTVTKVLGPVPLPSVPSSADALPLVGPVTTKALLATGGGSMARPVATPTLLQGVQPPGIATVLLERRGSRVQELLRQHPHELELDEQGRPIRRGILIALDADRSQLQRATKAGFRLVGEERHIELGIHLVRLTVPAGMSAPQAMKRLRRAAPLLRTDYDHLFEPTGGDLIPFAGALAAGRLKGGPKIGMVDGGVGSHPSLSKSSIAQRGFAGAARPTGHGTAVASLMVGREGRFRGAARGASLLVGDVYGGNRAAGSASVIVRALGWLVSNRPEVINISLVGPSNRVLARAVQAVRSRGIYIVAAVGNDGPAAPPPYPASYPGVLAVTGVDAQGRALLEAGRVDQLDFAAPGADMAAARPGRGYAKVRGTSFAAPLAAARLAAVGSPERLAAEARPGKGRVGRGIVCGGCRNDPRLVGAK